MRIYFSFFLFVCLSMGSYAQSLDSTSWHYHFDTSGTGFVQTISIGTQDRQLVHVYTNTSWQDAGRRIVLVKSDTMGNAVWKRCYSGNYAVDSLALYELRGVFETGDGRLAVFLVETRGQWNGIEGASFISYLEFSLGTGELLLEKKLNIPVYSGQRILRVRQDKHRNFHLITYAKYGEALSEYRSIYVKLGKRGVPLKGIHLYNNNLEDTYEKLELIDNDIFLTTSPARRVVRFDTAMNFKAAIRINDASQMSMHSVTKLSPNRILIPILKGISFQFNNAFYLCLDSMLQPVWVRKVKSIPFDTSGLYGSGYPRLSGEKDHKLYVVPNHGRNYILDTAGNLQHLTADLQTLNGNLENFTSLGNTFYIGNFTSPWWLKESHGHARFSVKDTANLCNSFGQTQFLVPADFPIVQDFFPGSTPVTITADTLTGLAERPITLCSYEGFCPRNPIRFNREYAFCQSRTLLLTKTWADQWIEWEDGDTSQRRTFTQPGLYYYRLRTPCFSLRDSVRLIPQAVAFSFPADSLSLCSGDSFRIGSPVSDGTLRWNDDRNQQVQTADTAQFGFTAGPTRRVVYLTRVLASGCGYTDSVVVKVLPPSLRVLPDTLMICKADTMLEGYRLYPLGEKWTWTSPAGVQVPFTILANTEGTFTLRFLQNGCKQADSTFLSFDHTSGSIRGFWKDSLLSSPALLTLATGDTLWFQVESAAKQTDWLQANRLYEDWGNNFPFVVRGDTAFVIKATYIVNGCRKEAIFNVRIEVTQPEIRFPNLVTDNDDGKNDRFVSTPYLPEGHMEIYNRWGKRVLNAPSYSGDWPSGIVSGLYFFHFKEKASGTVYLGWVQVIGE